MGEIHDMTKTPDEQAEMICQQEEKAYTLGPLTAKEIFPMVSIIGKIGIKQITEYLTGGAFEKVAIRLKALFSKNVEGQPDAGTENAAQIRQQEDPSTMEWIAGISVVVDVADIVIQHIPECKKEIIQILSNLSGMTPDKVEALRADIFFEMIIDVIKKEEFKNFYRVATKFIK